jgi:hypothetical protein
MSKIKIQGHSSGTGTVTITAPNTNSDRILTIPDITGTAITTGDTGTVTQSIVHADAVNTFISGRKNLIINGDMKIAQRGTSFTSHTGYTIDRYKGFGHTYTRIDNGDFYSLRMLWVTGTDANIYYPVELDRGQLENGQTYTLSFKYKSAGTDMTLECFYRVGTSGNLVAQMPTQTLPDSSGFSNYSITFTCQGRIATHTVLNLRFGNASGTKEIANVQLELGSVATDFEHRSYGEELALCQRYYQSTLNAAGGLTGNNAVRAITVNRLAAGHLFGVPMRDIPSVTIYSVTNEAAGYVNKYNASTTDLGGGGYYATGVHRLGWRYVRADSSGGLSVADGFFYSFKFTADAEL